MQVLTPTLRTRGYKFDPWKNWPRECCISQPAQRPCNKSIGAAAVGIGGDWSPPTFRLGDQKCIGPPKFLAVVFKKQEISQQVVTRMQDLASEFSKIFRGWYPRTLTAGGADPLPHPTPSPAFGWARRSSVPALGPEPWSPSTFQPW